MSSLTYDPKIFRKGKEGARRRTKGINPKNSKDFYYTVFPMDILAKRLAPDDERYRDIPKQKFRKGNRPHRYRGGYFRYYRTERKVLKALALASPVHHPGEDTMNYDFRRLLDKIVYYILPGLVKHLDWAPDQELIGRCVTFYNWRLRLLYRCLGKVVPRRFNRTMRWMYATLGLEESPNHVVSTAPLQGPV